MRFLLFIFLCVFIIFGVSAQKYDTVVLSSGLRIPCFSIYVGSVTIDCKTLDYGKLKLKPKEIDLIKFADGKISSYKEVNADDRSNAGKEDDSEYLMGVIEQTDTTKIISVASFEDSTGNAKKNSTIDINYFKTQRRLDSLSLAFIKLNDQFNFQNMSMKASGIYLKRAGTFLSTSIITSAVSSACLVLSAYYSTMHDPQGMKISNSFEVAGYIVAAVSLGCYIAIPINLIYAGKVLNRKRH